MFIQTRVKYVFGETRCGTPGHRDAVTRLVLQSDMLGLGHQEIAAAGHTSEVTLEPRQCPHTLLRIYSAQQRT